MAEQEVQANYLIVKALAKFNSQFGTKLVPEDFDIKSLEPRKDFDQSYEVFSIIEGDYLRLVMHLDFDNTEDLSNYRLETDGTYLIGQLGDEIYVATGKIDSYFKESGLMKFAPIVPDDVQGPIILTENNNAMYTETGDTILLEDEVV